ncbi:MAG: type II toxin-antitoxin system RelE/ParE family toxin [Bacteroidetes bacterium]|nr:type II toxin-antitoxin system RelE/ParE family toxin [Bacteroidota bacterium]
MGNHSEEIIYKPRANRSIKAISKYIRDKGYPDTSEKYAARLYDFGDSLANFPEKYPVCRFKKLADRNLRCAVFEQNYIFIYKTIHHRLVIYNVVHGRAIRY